MWYIVAASSGAQKDDEGKVFNLPPERLAHLRLGDVLGSRPDRAVDGVLQHQRLAAPLSLHADCAVALYYFGRERIPAPYNARAKGIFLHHAGNNRMVVPKDLHAEERDRQRLRGKLQARASPCHERRLHEPPHYVPAVGLYVDRFFAVELRLQEYSTIFTFFPANRTFLCCRLLGALFPSHVPVPRV